MRADARALPFAAAFDLAVSFGAFGHFLPARTAGLFAAGPSRRCGPAAVRLPDRSPRPAPSPRYWTLLGFDAVMRVRNALWRPPFVMYYRTFPLGDVRRDLERAGFTWSCTPCLSSGERGDGSPRVRLVVATRPG